MFYVRATCCGRESSGARPTGRGRWPSLLVGARAPDVGSFLSTSFSSGWAREWGWETAGARARHCRIAHADSPANSLQSRQPSTVDDIMTATAKTTHEGSARRCEIGMCMRNFSAGIQTSTPYIHTIIHSLASPPPTTSAHLRPGLAKSRRKRRSNHPKFGTDSFQHPGSSVRKRANCLCLPNSSAIDCGGGTIASVPGLR